MNVDSTTLAKLARFDTPTICNVIELFDIRPRNRGYMDGRIKCNFPELPPIVGFACTASFRSDAPPAGGDAYGSIGASSISSRSCLDRRWLCFRTSTTRRPRPYSAR